MGILDVLKKAFVPAEDENQSNISDAEIAFLTYCDYKFADLDSFSKTYKINYELDYPKTVKKLFAIGYLNYCDGTQSLQAYKVADLKLALKNESLPVSGDKKALIERIKSNNVNIPKHFSKQVFLVTPTGHNVISQYNAKKTAETKNKIQMTLTALQTNDYQKTYHLYESKSDAKNSLSLGYDRDSIKKDLDTLKDYISLKNPSEPEIIMAITTLTCHATYDSVQKILEGLGYDFSTEQIGYTHTLLVTMRSLKDFQGTSVKKYKIHSVKDGRTCSQCLEHHDKIFLISKAVLGKTAPPFCDKCRCWIGPVWDR